MVTCLEFVAVFCLWSVYTCNADLCAEDNCLDGVMVESGLDVRISKYSRRNFIEKIKDIKTNFKQNRDDFRLEKLEKFINQFRGSQSAGRNLQPLFKQLLEKTPESNASLQQCIKNWLIVLDDLKLFNNLTYSAHMLDAWGRPESGILEGNVRWPGSYYECWQANGPKVSGKWCQAYLGKLQVPYNQGFPLSISWGTCFPKSCSEEDVYAIISKLLAGNRLETLLQQVSCPVPFSDLTTTDIIAIVITVVLSTLILVGSSYEIYKRYSVNTSSRTGTHFKTKECSQPTSKLCQLALCFSVVSNTEKLLDTSRSPGVLPVLDGVRFLSTTWVVLGHAFFLPMYALDNPAVVNQFVKNNPSFMPIMNGTFSVDTFFLLSGLLVAYLGMKHLVKAKGKINILLMYLQRYLRLTPLYAYLILFSLSLYKYCGDGPYWVKFANRVYDQCDDLWYSNLLYFNNLYPEINMCYSWSWYLANDMQFYLLSPFLLILLYRWPKIGMSSLVTILLGSVITTGVLSIHSSLQPFAVTQAIITSIGYRFIFNPNDTTTIEEKYLFDIYTTPWSRISVYIIGMITGYTLFVTNQKIKMHKAVVIVGWITASVIALSVIYGLYEPLKDFDLMDENLAAFYNAVSRPAFGFSVAWLIIACVSGYGGPITTFLNWKVFIPLSRLTYSVYLIHLLVMQWFVATKEEPFHFSLQNNVYLYLGTLILTFGWSFVASVAIEWPFMRVLKVLFPMGPKETRTADNNRNHMDSNKENITQVKKNGNLRQSIEEISMEAQSDKARSREKNISLQAQDEKSFKLNGTVNGSFKSE
ncbi:O-acyltransferase like protein-like [Clavelina lepadiformis]|uniref:O-acyltransferase like protein-like n=1 Tax=Clavelina lepadiformis TaxID=159417 RepID=UPI0040431D9D